MRYFDWRSASLLAVSTIALGAAQDASAAAFQLRETMTPGTARAGSGATGGDLSAMFNNPATMATLDKNTIAVLGTVVIPSFKFHHESAAHSQTAADGTPIIPSTALTNRDGGNGGTVAVIPAAYLMWHMNDHWNFGLGVTVPFGMTTKYNSDWVGRYFSIKSKLQTIDVNPAVSYKVNNYLSVGAGASVQFAKADLTRAVWTIAGANPNPNTDAFSRLEGTSTGYGFNLGVRVSPWEHTHFGLAYRSAIKHTIKGDASVTGGNNPAIRFSRRIKADMTLPETLTFSAHHDITKRWAVMADAEWTRWSRLKSLNVRNEGSNLVVAGNPVPNGGQISSEAFDYKDTWFYSIGTQWQYRDDLMFKFGLAYDMTPTVDQHRSPCVPDADRIWFTTGLVYDVNDQFKVTADYAYIHFKDAQINLNRATSLAGGAATTTETLKGKFKSHTHLIGLKLQYKF